MRAENEGEGGALEGLWFNLANPVRRVVARDR